MLWKFEYIDLYRTNEFYEDQMWPRTKIHQIFGKLFKYDDQKFK
jgi:hypothetical protein